MYYSCNFLKSIIISKGDIKETRKNNSYAITSNFNKVYRLNGESEKMRGQGREGKREEERGGRRGERERENENENE